MIASQYRAFQKNTPIFEVRVERQRSEGNTRKYFLPLQIQGCDSALVLLKWRCLWTVEGLIHLFYPRAYIESYLPWKFYTVIQLCPKCNLKTWLICIMGKKIHLIPKSSNRLSKLYLNSILVNFCLFPICNQYHASSYTCVFYKNIPNPFLIFIIS